MLLEPAHRLPPSDAHLVWEPGGPYALRSTLGILQRGPQDPSTTVGNAQAWLCFVTSSGPVTVRVSRGGGISSPVLLEAWGPGAHAAVEHGLELLGATDLWDEFDAPTFRESLPPFVAQTRRAHPGLRFPTTGRMFDALLPAILEQKVTVIEAHFAYRYLTLLVGEIPPGPAPEGMRLPPSPESIRSLQPWQWHEARVDAKRAATAVRAAVLAQSLERWGGVPLGARRAGVPGEGSLEAALGSIPGIGPWSIAEVLQRTHGSPDHISVGDYHLAAFVGQVLTGRRVNDEAMLELLAPYNGHRQRVVRLLGASGVRKQAFGPRLAPMDHRRR
ncbi:3-methyladenine DNA glycosylase [Arthrobacter sp. MYb227]|uniref:DNA-3-methyladenine glycosylase family protein n=1 Tax=Arthrobacter sp. MYb227 TaxID=1848601 RepID=UPI000CFD1E5E|nr:3-methyladenine DNA glycosylase [Arthrobacter sp. MYb227]PQZ96173.1 3-methyladenine DNA glycosylase [Arthrobacter sp. MYb227]